MRFVRTLTANAEACAGTGAPPPISARAPIRAADLPLVRGQGTRAQRRALGLIFATNADMQEQATAFGPWGSARGLRGGRYVARADGRVRLIGARVVRDARVSGVLAAGERGVTGALRLSGRGVANGRLQVRLSAAGHGRATGTLAGQHVDLGFAAPNGDT
jgi:hypothetical protein